MIYTLIFLGLLAVALSLVASPVLVEILEPFFSAHDEGHAAAGLGSAVSNDRDEMRDEIRRVTNLLETGRVDPRHAPAPAGERSRVIRFERR